MITSILLADVHPQICGLTAGNFQQPTMIQAVA